MGSMDAAAIDEILERMRTRAGIPGAFVTVVNGDETYIQGYGVKEMGEKDPVTPDTLFANASTTKAFTAAGVALAVEDGKIKWDDLVRKHLPSFRLNDVHADAQVTISDLLCHRTGLPRHDSLWYRSPYGRQEILRRIGFAKLTAPFRTTYQYQNICYMAAGEAVRAATGAASFESFLRERLLTPLGMTRTNASSVDATADPDHATPHRRYGGKVYPIEWLNFDNCGPAGTLNSSAREMARWLLFQLTGGLTADGTRLLSEANLKQTHTPHTIVPLEEETRKFSPFLTQATYGLGWSIYNHRDGVRVLSHGGAIDGFRSHVALLPDKGIGLAVFVNAGAPLVESFRNALFDLLLGYGPDKIAEWDAMQKHYLKKQDDDPKDKAKEHRKQRKEGKDCPLPLSAFVSEYEDPAYGVIVIEKGKKALRLRWNLLDLPLRHQTFLTFLGDAQREQFGDIEASFTLKPTGEVASLKLSDGEFLPIPSK